MGKSENSIDAEKKFADDKYLKHGDLRQLANTLGVHKSSVYQVFQGVRENQRIEEAINSLIEIRKVQLNEIVNNVAGVNIN